MKKNVLCNCMHQCMSQSVKSQYVLQCRATPVVSADHLSAHRWGDLVYHKVYISNWSGCLENPKLPFWLWRTLCLMSHGQYHLLHLKRPEDHAWHQPPKQLGPGHGLSDDPDIQYGARAAEKMLWRFHLALESNVVVSSGTLSPGVPSKPQWNSSVRSASGGNCLVLFPMPSSSRAHQPSYQFHELSRIFTINLLF